MTDSLHRSDVVVLQGAAQSGKSAILRAVRASLGGALMTPATKETFLREIEEAILLHNLVLVDGLDVLTNSADQPDDPLSYVFDAALTAILADAGVLGCKLVFAVSGDAPWPIQRRALNLWVGAALACPA